MPIIHEREVVYIHDLVNDKGIVDGHKFEDCAIKGPAVLVLLHDCHVSNSSVGSPEAIWPPLPSNRGYIGAIGVQNCSFNKCRFEGIGFAGNEQLIGMMRKALGISQ